MLPLLVLVGGSFGVLPSTDDFSLELGRCYAYWRHPSLSILQEYWFNNICRFKKKWQSINIMLVAFKLFVYL